MTRSGRARDPREERHGAEDEGEPPELRKTEEFRTFVFLTVIMAPVLAVIGVGGYGFLVWIYQMIAGPPGSGL